MQTNNLKLIFFIAGALMVVTFSGCTTRYIPTQQNIPMFQEKGETEITASVSAPSGEYFYFEELNPPAYNVIPEIQIAYAATNHLALVAGGGKSFGDNTGFFAEAGAGLFTTLHQPRWEEKVIIGILGVAGYAKGFPETEYSSTGGAGNQITGPHAIRGFVQPYIGFQKKYTEVALSGRFTSYQPFTPPFDLLSIHKTYYFAEPAITIRAGLSNIKIHGQAAWIAELYTSDFAEYPLLSLSAGLSFRLPLKKEARSADF